MVTVCAEILSCPTCFSIPRKDNWAVYSVHAVWYTNATGEEVQKQIEYYENINNTRWNLTIQRVNYPNITISIIKELKNGTTSENYEGNVETGNLI